MSCLNVERGGKVKAKKKGAPKSVYNCRQGRGKKRLRVKKRRGRRKANQKKDQVIFSKQTKAETQAILGKGDPGGVGGFPGPRRDTPPKRNKII